MSTRSVIQVKFPRFDLYLYRHYDGYLSENGQVLAKALAELEEAPKSVLLNKLVAKLLGESYPAASYKEEEPVYKPVDGIPGDIECYYQVRLVKSAQQDPDPYKPAKYEIQIFYAGYDDGSKGYGNELLEKVKGYDLAGFQAIVEREVLSEEARVAFNNAKGGVE